MMSDRKKEIYLHIKEIKEILPLKYFHDIYLLIVVDNIQLSLTFFLLTFCYKNLTPIFDNR